MLYKMILYCPSQRLPLRCLAGQLSVGSVLETRVWKTNKCQTHSHEHIMNQYMINIQDWTTWDLWDAHCIRLLVLSLYGLETSACQIIL